MSLGEIRQSFAASEPGARNMSHQVQLYEDDKFLVATVAGAVLERFEAQESIVIVATQAHRQGIEAYLEAHGVALAPLLETGRYVFDLFAQGDVAIDHAQGGLGIGLTLVRRLIAMHGGRVEARSAGLRAGSEFEISLPVLSEVNEDEPMADSAASKGGSRILVVEDNADAAESLQMLLDLLGHQIDVACDGFAALNFLENDSYDVILIDIGLPGMDGYALAAGIHRLPNTASIRLVALTGYGQDDDRRRALAAGFDQHLVKPINIDRLQTLLAQ